MASENPSKPLSSATTYELSHVEILNLVRLVEEQNSINAAFRLYQYYAFSKYDKNYMMYYLEFAAKNGHTIAQHNLSYLYLEQNKLDEAYIWALKAKNGGNKYSDSILYEIKKRKKHTVNTPPAKADSFE